MIRHSRYPEISDALPGWIETYIGLEQAAAVIRGYQVQLHKVLFLATASVRSFRVGA